LSMLAAARLVGTRVRTPTQLKPVVDAGTSIGDADLKMCLQAVRNSFADERAAKSYADDKIAKRQDFIDHLFSRSL
jgi:hypothetical protein